MYTCDMPSNEYYTTKEVAKLYKVSAITVRRWLAQGRLRYVKVGRLYRIPQRSLDALGRITNRKHT